MEEIPRSSSESVNFQRDVLPTALAGGAPQAEPESAPSAGAGRRRRRRAKCPPESLLVSWLAVVDFGARSLGVEHQTLPLIEHGARIEPLFVDEPVEIMVLDKLD